METWMLSLSRSPIRVFPFHGIMNLFFFVFIIQFFNGVLRNLVFKFLKKIFMYRMMKLFIKKNLIFNVIFIDVPLMCFTFDYVKRILFFNFSKIMTIKLGALCHAFFQAS